VYTYGVPITPGPFSGGAFDGPVVAPTEADTTMAATGEWYWKPGQPIKSMLGLSALYDNTVGHDSNLLLGVPIDYTGTLCCDVLYCAMLYCALCCIVLHCAVLCCAVLCCAVLCCASKTLN
jgi:hypothetical protein